MGWWRESVRSEGKQFRELVKLFSRRFLENDLICLDGDTRATLVNVLGLAAAPGVFYPVLELLAFAFGYDRPLYLRDLSSIPDKALYLSFSMAVVGIATVLEWDTLLPDRRDYAVLRPFPLPLRTILAARIAALAGFWGVLTLAINGFSSLAFPVVVVQNAEFGTLAWFVRSHVIAVLAGNAFIFLVLLSAQGLLMNLLGWRGFRRVSPYAQTVLVAGMLVMFFTALTLKDQIQPGQPLSTALRFFPPAWFVGLYQSELGWTQPVFRALAAEARSAIWIAAATAAAAFALSYKRHVRRSLEPLEDATAAPGRLARALTAFTDRVLLRRATERASFHFVFRTLLRNRRHRALLGAFAGVGLALVSQSLAGVITTGSRDWWQKPRGPLLPAPIVLSFFLVCGMRYVFTLPAELRSNWIFQVSGGSDIREYMAGVRKAMVLLAILPLFAVLLPVHAAIWGWTAACVHVLFGFVVAYLLMDVLLVNFTKVPFTCSYVPGKANLRTFWWLYVLGFLIYVTMFSGFEYLILGKPSRIIWLFIFAAACETCLYLYRRGLWAEDFTVVFDERPEPAVRTLNLLEP